MVHIKDICLSFGSQAIFERLSWHVKPTRRIGLIGPNGTGKTTLLEMIAGNNEPDSGTMTLAPSTRVAYLPQQALEYSPDTRVIDHALGAFEDVQTLEREALDLAARLEQPEIHDGPEAGRLLERLDNIHAGLRARDSHTLRSRSEGMLTGLGFGPDDLERPLGTLSGGWRMRASLVRLLLAEPGLLLLDEPTNHLDIESIAWLEDYLRGFQGTMILVSHDRYFLDRMVDTIAELEGGALTEYAGNYTSYLGQRAVRAEHHRARYENQQKRIRQIETFIERFRYKNTKATQVQSRIRMLEKMLRIEPPRGDGATIDFKIPEPPRAGRYVVELSTFSKSYADPETAAPIPVFTNTGPLYVERGDRIALVGKNGAGKSTLARILQGTEPFEGTRKMGHNVITSFFAQDLAETLDPASTVLEELDRHSGGMNETSLRSLLGAFLFSGDDVKKRIGVLSGGEKSRVALAKILVQPTNFMILDEPTNHLDIHSREMLVEALAKYKGTFVVISHDRHFLDQVVNNVWHADGGVVHRYPGTYSEYLESTQHRTQAAPESAARAASADNSTRAAAKKASAERRNRLYRLMVTRGVENLDEWKELSPNQLRGALGELEERIRTTEHKRAAIEQELQDGALFDDRERSARITGEYGELERQIERLYERWDEISSHLGKDPAPR